MMHLIPAIYAFGIFWIIPTNWIPTRLLNGIVHLRQQIQEAFLEQLGQSLKLIDVSKKK